MELVRTGSRGRTTLGEKLATSEYCEVEKGGDGTIALRSVRVVRTAAPTPEDIRRRSEDVDAGRNVMSATLDDIDRMLGDG
ncbi:MULTISPECIES: hypothetical protein [unclassified Nocardiopsis]|uniref:hypothetical protein n=1 Tax=unclassified Nocardiopsis TaxID=2649073 RepID=UPI001161403C|nr:hypothetical protein [Nocardiopsis sp. TSRI0078]